MHKALNPNDPLPDLPAIIRNYLQPPKALLAQCQPQVDKLKEVFKLETVKVKDVQVADDMWKDK